MSAAEQLRHAPHTAVPGVTPAPPPYTQAMRMNSLNTLNGAGPQVSTMIANVCQIPGDSYDILGAFLRLPELVPVEVSSETIPRRIGF